MTTKHVRMLREIAKFATGLVAADFLMGVWFYFGDLLPMEFFGVTFTKQIIFAGMAFDFVLILILLYYAWHIEIPAPSSIHRRSLFFLVGTLLSLVSILHLLRLVFGVEISIGSWSAPFWLSWIGTVVAGYLGYASFQFANHK